MHLFVNSLAASAGGGLTYIRSVLPQLAARSGVQVTVALGPELRKEFFEYKNVTFVNVNAPLARRFWYEQSQLPNLIRRSGADLLLSTGNFALRNSPVSQLLLSRNSVYTSQTFYRDLLARREYGMWLDTRVRAILAKKSIAWADLTVAPSAAFAAELNHWTDREIVTVHHGFDFEAFTRDHNLLPPDVEAKLSVPPNSLKLLFVSHYNYYRNFETLIRALPILRDSLPGKPIRLWLTARFEAGANPGSYNPKAAANLVESLGVSEMVVQLGPVPYHLLHHLYSRADLYVTPAYTETFAHPLVEAMASRLPIVASDLAVHREICGEAGVYFPPLSPQDLAAAIVRVSNSSETSRRMAEAGRERSRTFSWVKHVDAILKLSEDLINSNRKPV